MLIFVCFVFVAVLVRQLLSAKKVQVSPIEQVSDDNIPLN